MPDMFNRLNDEQTPDYFVKRSAREQLNTTIDEAHREMTTYQSLPYGDERKAHFSAFLRKVEEASHHLQDCLDLPLAHSNRVRRGHHG